MDLCNLQMIDLHTHILPGLDDGPTNWDEALEMHRLAFEDGIRVIVVTPHIMPGVYDNDKLKILTRLAELNRKLKSREGNIKLIPGAEVYLSPEVIEAVRNDRVLTIGDMGKYFLVELPELIVPSIVKTFIFRLKLLGITPILSHPERNREIVENPNWVYDFVIQGALVQINAASLTGDFGKDAFQTARMLLRSNCVHILASDAHSPLSRPPVLSEGLKIAAKWVGRKDAARLVTENPRKVIEGKGVGVYAPPKVCKTSFGRKMKRFIRSLA